VITVDIVDKIIDYEAGLMNDDEIISMFQELITNGTVWQLQGHYGRTARNLIDLELCHIP
jgi:hypothetical protein